MLDSGHRKAQSRSDVGQRNYIEQMMLSSEKTSSARGNIGFARPASFLHTCSHCGAPGAHLCLGADILVGSGCRQQRANKGHGWAAWHVAAKVFLCAPRGGRRAMVAGAHCSIGAIRALLRLAPDARVLRFPNTPLGAKAPTQSSTEPRPQRRVIKCRAWRAGLLPRPPFMLKQSRISKRS